jgi:hypothetical protein
MDVSDGVIISPLSNHRSTLSSDVYSVMTSMATSPPSIPGGMSQLSQLLRLCPMKRNIIQCYKGAGSYRDAEPSNKIKTPTLADERLHIS